MSAGDWGAGSFWRMGIVLPQYTTDDSTGLISGCVLNYAVHVPSGDVYEKSLTWVESSPLPVDQTLTVILNASGDVTTYEGIPIG